MYRDHKRLHETVEAEGGARVLGRSARHGYQLRARYEAVNVIRSRHDVAESTVHQ